jgi:hypothetical protein
MSVNCVLIISGMYAAHNYWIQTEIDITKAYRKPIVGLIPLRQERIPLAVQQAANELAAWRTDSVVDAIRGGHFDYHDSCYPSRTIVYF